MKEIIIKNMLKIIKRERSFFTSNPQNLLPLMNKIHMMQISIQDDFSVWDEIESLKISKSYEDMINAAYSHEIKRIQFQIPNSHYKSNKTLSDIRLILDSCETELDVLNHIFLTIGTGLKWTKDGFIDEDSAVSYPFFNNKLTSNPELNQELMSLLTPEIKELIKNHQKLIDQENSKYDSQMKKFGVKTLSALLDLLDGKVRSKKTSFYPISLDHSLIASIPANAHQSYRDGAKRLCQEIINLEPKSSENYKFAKKYLTKEN